MVVFSQEKLFRNVGIKRATMFSLMDIENMETKPELENKASLAGAKQ